MKVVSSDSGGSDLRGRRLRTMMAAVGARVPTSKTQRRCTRFMRISGGKMSKLVSAQSLVFTRARM